MESNSVGGNYLFKPQTSCPKTLRLSIHTAKNNYEKNQRIVFL